MTVTAKEHQDIKRNGFAYTGGLPRRLYWTPDGREIKAIPSEREFRRTDPETQEVTTGIRDANLDKGWLTEPPKNPLPYCSGCTNWHATQEEVDECIDRKEATQRKYDDQALKQQQGEAMAQAKEMDDLKVEVQELKGSIHELISQNKKLMEKLEE